MRSIDRQQRILNALAASPATGCSVRALSSDIGLPVSSTHRFLQALASVGMVVQRRETSNYHLGHGILRLAGTYLEKVGLPDLAVPYLEDLTFRTGLMAFASTREGTSVICTGVRAPDETTNFYVRIGKLMPLHATSAAKALIYHLHPSTLETMLVGTFDHHYTAKTHTSSLSLMEDLARGRARGYWECDEELEPDVYAVSAPILDGNGEPRISLTTLCHLSRGRESLDEVRTVLQDVTTTASRDIGMLLYASRFLEVS